jgi:cytochrome c-type biogenesis protein CcmH/NrfG
MTRDEREQIEAASSTLEIWKPYGSIAIRHHMDGKNREDKFTRDAALLKAIVEKDPEDARAWFYLGQSLEALGQTKVC